MDAIAERNRNRLTGQAGVYRVAAALLLRGFIPHFPSVDCGSDLTVQGGLRVQVKTSRLRFHCKAYPQGAYYFKLTHACGKRRGQPRTFSTECDFVVLWGVDHDRFWVVPAPMLDGRQLVVVGPDVHWVDADVEAIEQLYDQGLTQSQIAEQLGLTEITISRRLRGLYLVQSPTRALSSKVRACEGRWDYVEAAVRTLVQATSISPSRETIRENEVN